MGSTRLTTGLGVELPGAVPADDGETMPIRSGDPLAPALIYPPTT